MADRAASDDGSPESIVDLANDDRWQARLEEARARREIALREKGKDPSAAPKRKPMPWELEASADAKFDIEPIIQAPDSDRVDFADRVDRVRETVTRDANTGDFGAEPLSPRASAATSPLPTSFEDLLTDDAFEDEEEEVNWAPPPKKPHSAISDSAPDVIELASRYASTLTPEADDKDGVTDVFEDTPPVAAVASRKINPPALLVIGVVFLAAMPFTKIVPPLDRGPAMPATPTLRLEPALGFTTAMLWRPAETSAADWSPAATWALPLSTIYSPRAPEFETRPATLAAPSIDQGTVAFDTPSAEMLTPRSVQPAALDGAAIDRLPGAYTTRRPEPRPLPGEPVASTQVPSRLPDVVRGNEPSPKIAPVTDPDSTLLEQVTELTAVMFDPAPVMTEQALKAPEAAAPAAPERVLQLTILVPSKGDEAVAGKFAQDASERGHEIAAIKNVDLSIKSRNVRYFFEADRAEALRLANAYGAQARDFTWFNPKPSAGTVELWLEGRAAPPVRAPRVVQTAPAIVEPTPAPAPTVIVVRKQEGFLTRLFGGHRAGSVRTVGVDGASDATDVAAPTAPSGDDTDTSGGTDTDTRGSGTGTDTGAGTDTGTGTGTGTGTDSGDTSGGTSSGDDTTGTGSTGTGTSGGSTGTGSGSSDDDGGSAGGGGSSGAGTGSGGGGGSSSGSSGSGASDT